MERSVRIAAAFVLVLTSLLFGASAGSAAPAQAGTTETYLVLYKANSVPADAATSIANAGGTLVYAYDAIGVAIARSDSAGFRDALLKDKRVDGASATTGFGSRLEMGVDDETAADAVVIPAGFNYQWDMK